MCFVAEIESAVAIHREQSHIFVAKDRHVLAGRIEAEESSAGRAIDLPRWMDRKRSVAPDAFAGVINVEQMLVRRDLPRLWIKENQCSAGHAPDVAVGTEEEARDCAAARHRSCFINLLVRDRIPDKEL